MRTHEWPEWGNQFTPQTQMRERTERMTARTRGVLDVRDRRILQTPWAHNLPGHAVTTRRCTGPNRESNDITRE